MKQFNRWEMHYDTGLIIYVCIELITQSADLCKIALCVLVKVCFFRIIFPFYLARQNGRLF